MLYVLWRVACCSQQVSRSAVQQFSSSAVSNGSQTSIQRRGSKPFHKRAKHKKRTTAHVYGLCDPPAGCQLPAAAASSPSSSAAGRDHGMRSSPRLAPLEADAAEAAAEDATPIDGLALELVLLISRLLELHY